jgi:hypothetical protein
MGLMLGYGWGNYSVRFCVTVVLDNKQRSGLKCSRGVWGHSSALKSWVRSPMKERIYVRVLSVFTLSCAKRGRAMGSCLVEGGLNQLSLWFRVWLILRRCRWRRCVSPKRWSTSNCLYGVIFQKTLLLRLHFIHHSSSQLYRVFHDFRT